TLTPVVEDLRPFFKVPIIAIDDAMGRKAVESGKKIALMATARSTVLPTMNKIKREAQGIGKEVILSEEVVQEAFQAMKTGDMVTHDRLLLQRTAEIKDVDCVVLAQASMAHLRDE